MRKDLHAHIARTATVNTAEMTVTGTIEVAGTESVTLTHASLADGSGGTAQIEGAVVIPYTRIEWLVIS